MFTATHIYNILTNNSSDKTHFHDSIQMECRNKLNLIEMLYKISETVQLVRYFLIFHKFIKFSSHIQSRTRHTPSVIKLEIRINAYIVLEYVDWNKLTIFSSYVISTLRFFQIKFYKSWRYIVNACWTVKSLSMVPLHVNVATHSDLNYPGILIKSSSPFVSLVNPYRTLSQPFGAS